MKNLLSLLGSTLSINCYKLKQEANSKSTYDWRKYIHPKAISLLKGIKLKNLPTNKNKGLPVDEELLKYEVQ